MTKKASQQKKGQKRDANKRDHGAHTRRVIAYQYIMREVCERKSHVCVVRQQKKESDSLLYER